MIRKWGIWIAAAAAACAWVEAGAAEHAETIDLAVAHRIRSEAFGKNSKAMDTAFYLTDVHGPRLTGSPAARRAAEWAAGRLREWGLSNVKLEPWGPFGRGWSCTRFVAEMTAPEFQPLIGFAQAWSPGTAGEVTGSAVLAVIASPEDFDQWHGKLRGKIVLGAAPHPSEMMTTAPAHRLSDAELAEAATAPEPTSGNPAALPLGFIRPGAGGRGGARGQREFRARLNKFYQEEGVLLVLSPGAGPDGGTVMGSAAGSQNPDDVAPPPSVVVTDEHYNRIVRLLDKQIPATLAFDIQAQFTAPEDSFNITAEIPGAVPDPGLVMLGGHFDSWTGGTGATDNAAGSVVAMEAMRILKSLDLKMPRTVRLALWTGEEQGLLGSRAYVKEHFADPADMKTKPEHARLSAYYNLDNGSGKIRGVYLQDNDEMRPIFDAWLEPFHDLGAATLTIRNTGSTDHMSFDAVGLPAFEFIQDPLEYSSRTHHSNMDVYDRLQPDDLEQAAAIMAWFVYNTATRPDLLPRKPMPRPAPRESAR
ncbi:MAG: M20/M25/M40 family metallo-hydrolase [Bryobacteraceae bacterium]